VIFVDKNRARPGAESLEDTAVRVGTPLENWRAAESSLSAIDRRIADLSGRQDPSSAESSTIADLRRARTTAKERADRCWVLYLNDIARREKDDTQS
jgi:hypothetical protein